MNNSMENVAEVELVGNVDENKNMNVVEVGNDEKTNAWLEMSLIAARDSARKILSVLAPDEKASIIASTRIADDAMRSQLREVLLMEEETQGAETEAALEAEGKIEIPKEIIADVEHLQMLLEKNVFAGKDVQLLLDALNVVDAFKREKEEL